MSKKGKETVLGRLYRTDLKKALKVSRQRQVDRAIENEVDSECPIPGGIDRLRAPNTSMHGKSRPEGVRYSSKDKFGAND